MVGDHIRKRVEALELLGVSESSIHVETENQSPGTDRRERKNTLSSPPPSSATKVDTKHNVDEKLAHTSYEDEAIIALKRAQILEKERNALASVASAAELRYREANRLLQDESSASAALLNRVHRLERELFEMKQKDQQEHKQDSLIDGAGLSMPRQNQYVALEKRVDTQEKEISILRAGLKSSEAALQSMQESRDRAEARCLELAKDRDRALDEISALKASLQDLAPSHERETAFSMSRGKDFEQRLVKEQEARLAQEMLCSQLRQEKQQMKAVTEQLKRALAFAEQNAQREATRTKELEAEASLLKASRQHAEDALHVAVSKLEVQQKDAAVIVMGKEKGKEIDTLPEEKTMLLSDCAACFADCAREIESVRTSIIEICRA